MRFQPDGFFRHLFAVDHALESFRQQRADLTGYDGKTLKARNIIGAFNPDAKRRVLLCAHWDTRPWADNDPDEANHHKPILGANDGASGVGVLLEVARQLQQQAPAIGVDIIFFDMEDSGTPQFASSMGDDSHTWCLGSQYWARAPHVQGYNARFGILLDMVGGKGATFLREGYSMQHAPSVVKKVWKAAAKLGFGNYFIDEDGVTAAVDGFSGTLYVDPDSRTLAELRSRPAKEVSI